VIWGGSLTTGTFAGQAREQWSEAEPNGPLLLANDTGWFFKASNVLPFGELHGNKSDYVFGDHHDDALYGGSTAPAKPPALHDDAAAGKVSAPTIKSDASANDAQAPAASGDNSSWVGDFVNHLGKSAAQRNPNAAIQVHVGGHGK
jgi:hypothetical protein